MSFLQSFTNPFKSKPKTNELRPLLNPTNSNLVVVTCSDIDSQKLDSLKKLSTSIFTESRIDKFINQNEFSELIQTNSIRKTSKTVNYKIIFEQSCKFYLLKGDCNRLGLTIPQRKIIFNKNSNQILFYQKENEFISIDIYHFFYFIYQISPYISYRILLNLQNFFHNPENQMYLTFFTNYLSGGDSSLSKGFELSSNKKLFNVNLAYIKNLFEMYTRNGNIHIKLKYMLLISVYSLIPGTTKIINFYNQMNRNFLKNVESSVIHIHSFRFPLENVFLSNYTQNAVCFDTDACGLKKNKETKELKITNEKECKRRKIFCKDIKDYLPQLYIFDKQIQIFNFYKHTYNTLVLVKLLFSDKTNPEILPFKLNWKLLMNFEYIDEDYARFISNSPSRNMKSSLRGLILTRIKNLYELLEIPLPPTLIGGKKIKKNKK
jgi:hypothetical protein